MSDLSFDHYKEIMRLLEEYRHIHIDAILLTDRDYLIPRGRVYKLHGEEKEYYAMNKADFDEMIETGMIKRAKLFPEPAGILQSFSGIPVVEANEKIQEFFVKAIEKQYDAMLRDFMFRPEITVLTEKPNSPEDQDDTDTDKK